MLIASPRRTEHHSRSADGLAADHRRVGAYPPQPTLRRLSCTALKPVPSCDPPPVRRLLCSTVGRKPGKRWTMPCPELRSTTGAPGGCAQALSGKANRWQRPCRARWKSSG